MTTQSDTPGEGLANCPFCGGEAELDYSRHFRAMSSGNLEKAVAIYCLQCSADMTLCRSDHREYDAKQLAEILTENWNRRSPSVASDTAALPSGYEGLRNAIRDEVRRFEFGSAVSEYLADAVMKLIAALGRVEPVAVKPLEWVEVTAARSDEDPSLEHTGDYETETPFGTYYIEQYLASDSYGWEVTMNGYEKVADKDDPEEAKATAQADFEKRIMSALKPVAGAARLFDDHQPMSCAVGEITAAEDVLSWLIIEKCGAPDDRSYTPHEAQKIIEDALALATPPAPQPAPASAIAYQWTARGDSQPFMRLSSAHPGDGGDVVSVRPLGDLQPVLALIEELTAALEPFAKYAGDLGIPKQRFFLQLLVCPDGDDHPEDYGPHFQAARAALASAKRFKGE